MIRVLLVDDDVELCHLQADYLQRGSSYISAITEPAA